MTVHRGAPPAVVETRIVHDGQRRATTLLADLLGAPPGAPVPPAAAVAELRDFVVASLDHHHRLEDTDLWPTLVAADPDLSAPLADLSAEHELLDAELSDLARVDLAVADGRARRAAEAVRDRVHQHLAHEEPVLFPALEAHVSDERWAEFSQRAVASTPQVGTHLLVGFLDEAGTPDQLDLIFRHLPPEARAALPTVRAQARAAIADLDGAVAGGAP
jgi:hemerythrin-like domain-containing protein